MKQCSQIATHDVTSKVNTSSIAPLQCDLRSPVTPHNNGLNAWSLGCIYTVHRQLILSESSTYMHLYKEHPLTGRYKNPKIRKMGSKPIFCVLGHTPVGMGSFLHGHDVAFENREVCSHGLRVGSLISRGVGRTCMSPNKSMSTL